jgi:sortase A
MRVRIDHVLMVSGAALCCVFAISRIHGGAARRAAHLQFAAQTDSSPMTPTRPTFAGWAAARIAAYERALGRHIAPPVGLLSIPRLHLEVPVYEGTSGLALNRGAGHIPGTSRPGEDGNVGITGHRDGFFRALKDVTRGDRVELRTAGASAVYVVDRIAVVDPSHAEVLEQRQRSELTLVTCYPFYFIGDAPSRFIVQGSLEQRDAARGI